MESQQHSKTWKGRRRVWKKLPIPTPTSPPPPKKKGTLMRHKPFSEENIYLFIYLFVYYPIEDKHEL
jgi:hypothetical protein